MHYICGDTCKAHEEEIRRLSFPDFQERTKGCQLCIMDELAALKAAPPATKKEGTSAWVKVDHHLPNEREWVLHAYLGVRKPEYGLFKNGRFWREDGPESFPTTHWMRVPSIDTAPPARLLARLSEPNQPKGGWQV